MKVLIRYGINSINGVNPNVGTLIRVADDVEIPEGWLLCEGQIREDLSMYPALQLYMEGQNMDRLPRIEEFNVQYRTIPGKVRE